MQRTLQQLLRGGGRSLRITQCSLQLHAPRAALQPWALRLRALLCRPDSGTGRCEQSLYSTIIFAIMLQSCTRTRQGADGFVVGLVAGRHASLQERGVGPLGGLPGRLTSCG